MRVLFVLGKYLPKPSANGVCVSRVQEQLLKMGIASDVICESNQDTVTENRYGIVYSVDLITADKLSAVERILAVLRYPIYFPKNIDKFRSTIDKALSENIYDAIIAVLKPADGGIAATKYSNLLIYELDSITNNVDNEHGIRRFLKHRTYKVEQLLYENAVWIFHMMSHNEFYERSYYKKYADKCEYLDIPQLIDEQIVDQSCVVGETINILYSGTLNDRMRSPKYAITLIKGLLAQRKVSIRMDFYSRGNCETVLEQAEAETQGAIKKHGYVPLDVLNRAVSETKFLLSIGNSLDGTVTSLPSKVISYMAYGKPIIHIDGGENDVAKDYLRQYPLIHIVDPKKDIQQNIMLLMDFIQNNLDKRVSFDQVAQVFKMNTPEYTAQQIKETIETRCCGKVMKIK